MSNLIQCHLAEVVEENLCIGAYHVQTDPGL